MSTLIDATNKKITRPFCVPALLDFDKSVRQSDKQTLMKRSRRAYYNNSLVKAIIDQRALFVTKGGWQYKSLVEDKDWRMLAEEYFKKWERVACVSGMDYQTLLHQINLSIDKDGDAFVLMVESRDGFPQLEWIPPNRVGTRNNEDIVTSGRHKGKKVVSGVIVNDFNRPVAYNILADDESQDRVVDAVNVIHIFERQTGENLRGIPLVSHCLQELEDLEESKNAELVAQRTYATTALIEHLGQEDDNATFLNTSCGTSTNPNSTPLFETFNEGQIVVYRSQNSDLKALESNRPSLNWQMFRDKIIQSIVVSCGWSVSMLDGNDFTSVGNRINIRVVEGTISDRINLLAPFVQKIAFYVLSKAIDNGDLPAIPEYWKMTFTRPAFLSADISRIEESTRQNLQLGITTLSQIVEKEGRTLEDHIREKYTEQALDQIIKQEIEARYNVTLSQPTPTQPQ